MKREIIIGCLGLLLLTSCTGNANIYEKAIADFVQTNKKGVWTDLQFKVIEMGAPVEITVGDSIKILTDEFETLKSERLVILTESLEQGKVGLAKETLPTMQKYYRASIDKYQSLVDSATKTTVSLPESYRNSHTKMVLAKEITCKFSIILPSYNTRQEMTETFILSADGAKCYRKKGRDKTR